VTTKAALKKLRHSQRGRAEIGIILMLVVAFE
jgi:hypothetical protein